jgi:hypothetical protein
VGELVAELVGELVSKLVDELAVLLDEFFAADSVLLGCMHHDRGQAEIHDVASVLAFE